MSSTLIAMIGLGNPGPKYEDTRHNAGFWLLEQLARRGAVQFRREAKFFGEAARIRLGSRDVVLLKPDTFMNRSGQAVAALCNFYKIQPTDVLIAHDEMDLPAGVCRLKQGGGHGGHNGLRDVHKAIGNSYRRLRIGIGHPGDREQVLNYVLGRPNRDDSIAIDQGIAQSVDCLDIWLSQDQGWEKALQRLHTKSSK